MKQLLKKGEEYSFFNPKNLLAGFVSIIVIIIVFLVAGSTEYAIKSPVGDIGGEPSFFVILLSLFFFLLPSIFMGRKHRWKASLSTFLSGALLIVGIYFIIF